MMIRRVLAMLVLSALTACGRSTPSTGTEGSALPKGPDAAEPGQQWTNVIGGVPTTLADAASVVPFTVVTPEGLGTPVAVYVTDPSVGSIKDRVVEFDFDTADYGRVVVEEAVPEVPVADWQKYVDLLLSQNGDPQLHGSISSSTIRGGQVALLTTSEDGSQSDIRWLENDSIEIYVSGPSLTIDQCMQIGEKF